MHPRHQVGRLSQIWIQFGKLYDEKLKHLDDARNTFKRAIQVDFARVEELAQVWCEWVEMELRHGYTFSFDTMLLLMKTVFFVGQQQFLK